MGKQFTERLLPDFLLPGRVIRADLTLKSLEEAREPLNLEKACSILGCIDIRTARNSLRYGYQAIKKACISLEEKLAPFSGSLQAYHFTPDTPLLSSFQTLINRFNQLQIHIHGGTGYVLQCLNFTLLSSHWPKKKSMAYVCDPQFSPDTS
jgi:hypothetical protein